MHERHPELTVTVNFQDHELVQEAHPNVSAKIKRVSLPEVLNENELIEMLDSSLGAPFDLANGPLEDPNHHVVLLLLLRIHHMILDAWTTLIILNEIGAIYSALIDNQPMVLSAYKHSYKDYVFFLPSFIESPEAERQKQYWLSVLENVPMTLELPTDYRRPSISSFQCAHHKSELKPSSVQALSRLCEAQNISRYVLYMSIFEMLLYRYSGQN